MAVAPPCEMPSSANGFSGAAASITVSRGHAHPVLVRDVVDVPLAHAAAALVVADEAEVLGEEMIQCRQTGLSQSYSRCVSQFDALTSERPVRRLRPTRARTPSRLLSQANRLFRRGMAARGRSLAQIGTNGSPRGAHVGRKEQDILPHWCRGASPMTFPFTDRTRGEPMTDLHTNRDPSMYARCIDASKKIRWDIDADVIRGRRSTPARIPAQRRCRSSTSCRFSATASGAS